MKKSISYLHRIAGVFAFLIILSFFSSTLITELMGDQAMILTVKTVISYGVWILIPLMMITGISGIKMAPKANAGPIGNKKKRMPFIALNGLLILLPCAIYLQHLASSGSFDTTFYTVQAAELIAGFINLVLMSLNIRDGIRVVRAKK
ncbi:hypothetical protein [Amphritea sp.]|uniref:hypothetical protein n=1 Tax=Amphritea sp. TaxID=1872502 RepID=UPI0025C4D74E|nr:hypothetical protein [Amphritea sp.]